MKTAYLDCFSGISGDMLLGALLDGGVPLEALTKAIETVPFRGYALDARKEKRHHISGTRFTVKDSSGKKIHRNLSDIKKLIEDSNLSAGVKGRSKAVFERLAVAEAQIHGVSLEEVHFHEVGAVDSIIDIVGAVFCIEYLGITDIRTSTLPLGNGFTKSMHGTIPVPAPATVALLKGVPVYSAGIPFEMVTPTGAALVTEFSSSFGTMPPMAIDSIGYGVGTRDLPDRPNLLRILIGRHTSGPETETVSVIETDMDDANPEWLGYAMERLFEAGALDVVFMPAQMKKNRPGVHAQVISPPHLKGAVTEVLFRETGTLGVRTSFMQRRIMERQSVRIETPWGMMNAKQAGNRDGTLFIIPEYEECRRIAIQENVPLRSVYAWVSGLNHSSVTA